MGDLANDLACMDIDSQQDIARSSYADMLHDDERNHAYYVAIRTIVNYLVNSKDQNPDGIRHFKCCDIGTGSGLLSMMVARSFLDLNYSSFHVTAYDCFEPMCRTAKSIIESNNLSKYIDIQTKQIGTNDDEKHENRQYDLLVAELLDTELIGEGCLAAYRFVVENWCSPNCFFIPREARIYIEPICSRGLFRRQIFRDYSISLDGKREISIEFDKEVKACSGLSELDDMQTSYLEDSFNFEKVTEPKLAFEFIFNDLKSLKMNNERKLHFTTKKELNQEIVVLMWWDIVMYDGALFTDYGPQDNDKKYSFSKLSNAPSWSRGKYQRERDEFISKLYNRDIWREHWMQAIYYLPCHEGVRSLCGKREEQVEFDIYAYHDSHSLFFDLIPCRSKSPASCTCGVHRHLNRYEVSFLNNSAILQDLIKAKAQSNLEIATNVKNKQNLKGRLRMIDSSRCDSKWRLDFWFKNDSEFNVEPAINLLDFSLMDDVCWRILMNRFLDGQDISPIASFKIVYNQVAFHALNRIRMQVGHCQGFDLRASDQLIEQTARLVDSSLEAHHLWEYGCDILSPDIVVFDSEQFNRQRLRDSLSENDEILSELIQVPVPLTQGRVSIDKLKSQWALVFSCNMKLVNGKIIKTGHLMGETRRKWNHHFKQLVHFLHNHPILETDEVSNYRVELKMNLTRQAGISIQRIK